MGHSGFGAHMSVTGEPSFQVLELRLEARRRLQKRSAPLDDKTSPTRGHVFAQAV